MKCPLRHEEAVFACLLSLFVCRAVLASAIVPPWQGPDEPTHVSGAQWLALPKHVANAAPLLTLLDGQLIDAERQNVHRQVLESMARHGWWKTRGVTTPEPIPTFFHQVERGRLLPVASYAQPLYYGLGAVVLRMTTPDDIEGTYWRLRLLSVLLSLATLVFGWAGTRLLFGSAVAAGATAIGVLHPQFLLTAISANPDALVGLCGAAAWWLAARVICDRRRALSLILLLIAAGAAPFIKRSAMPLGAVAIIIAALLFVAQAWPMIRRQKVMTAIVMVAVIAGVGLMGLLLLNESELRVLATIWRSGFIVRRPPDRATLTAAIEYARTSIDFAWLIAGWVEFRASESWLWVVRVLTVIGMAGAAVLVVTSPALRWRLALAWLFFVPQVAAVVVRGFWSLAAPEGRHAFAVFAPAAVLLWLGLTHVLPARMRPLSSAVVVATLALMDVTGFTTVLIPAYVPSIISVP